jgi:hypothetical protein
MTLGGGLGVKIPAGDRLAVRMEGGFAKALENEGEGLSALNILSARIGISFIN